MAFHLTSRYINVNDKQLLSAKCQCRNREIWAAAFIPLNDVLGNEDGAFKWGSNNFGVNAKDIKLTDGHVLWAKLKRDDGTWIERPVAIDLAERIENLDGVLFYHSIMRPPRRYLAANGRRRRRREISLAQ